MAFPLLWHRDNLNWNLGFFLSAVAGLALLLPRIRQVNWRVHLVTGLLLLAGLFCAFTPGMNWAKYNHFVFFPLALLSSCLFGALYSLPSTRRVSLLAYLGFTLGTLLLNPGNPYGLPCFHVVDYNPNPRFLVSHPDSIPRVRSDEISRIVLSFANPGESLGIWGLSSRYYVMTEMPPATRYIYSCRWDPVLPPPLLAQRRYLEDLRRSQPPVFLDMVGPLDHMYHNRAQEGVQIFPELARYLADNYRIVAGGAATIYVSRRRLEEMHLQAAEERPAATPERTAPDGTTTPLDAAGAGRTGPGRPLRP